MPISYTPSLALLKPAAAVRIPSIHKNKRSKKMSNDIFFLFLGLRQTNLFVGRGTENKRVDLSTSCEVQFL